MAKKNGKKEGGGLFSKVPNINPGLKEDTVHAVLAILSFVLALLFILASLHKSGVAGDTIFKYLTLLFGVGYYLLPVLFFMLGVSFVRSVRPNVAVAHVLGSVLFLLSGLGIIDITLKESAGGIIGGFVSYPLIKLFEVYVSLVVLVGALLISLLIIFDARPNKEFFLFWKKFKI